MMMMLDSPPMGMKQVSDRAGTAPTHNLRPTTSRCSSSSSSSFDDDDLRLRSIGIPLLER